MSDTSIQQKIEAWRASDPAGYAAAVKSIMAKTGDNWMETAQAPTTAALDSGILTPEDLQGTSERLSVDPTTGLVSPHQGMPVAAKIAEFGIPALATAGTLDLALSGGGAAAAGAGGAPDAASGGAATVASDVPSVGPVAGGGVMASDGTIIPGAVGPGLSSGTSVLSDVGKYAKNLLSKTGLGAISEGIAGATQQAAQNRIAQNDPYVKRGQLEMAQRNNALKQAYIANQTMNPRNSPFDPNPVQAPTGAYATDMTNVAGQDQSQLATPPQYLTSQFPSLQPGTLEQIGQWAGPILSVLSKL